MSSNIYLIGVISLFVCYWLPPMTMDAVWPPLLPAGEPNFNNT